MCRTSGIADRFGEIVDQVVYVLDSYADANGVIEDSGGFLLLFCTSDVERGIGMDGQCADISDITGDHRVFQAVENSESPFSASCPEGENAAAEALELCAAKVSVRAALKQRIVDLDSIDAAQSLSLIHI